MRRALILVMLPVVMGAAAADTAFDGVYRGAIMPQPEALAACAAFNVPSLTVTHGRFASTAPALSGFVNIKGYVTGRMKMADGHVLALEGRAEEIDGAGLHLTAGIVDDRNGCAWTLDLEKVPAP